MVQFGSSVIIFLSTCSQLNMSVSVGNGVKIDVAKEGKEFWTEFEQHVTCTHFTINV